MNPANIEAKMDQESGDAERRAFVVALYASLLRRSPSERELLHWTAAAERLSGADMVHKFTDSIEYKIRNKITPFFPIGHYHSPIVDPSTLGDYLVKRSRPGVGGFGGIDIDIGGMEEFWDSNKEIIRGAPFPETKEGRYRFFFEGAPFPYGDALVLHAIIGHFRPRRIVEIGSGFSTACMLDSAEIHRMDDLEITCIEPYPDRLKSLLRPSDGSKIRLLSRPLQEIPVEDIVKELASNDILFIDSTHVLKTGSDVHYEIFEIIPAVKPGVIVHVHDCPYPFEYPLQWIEKNYSWNEVYAIRAFLMYNSSYRMVFWGSLFKSLFAEKVKREGGRFYTNAGTSLWLVRVS